MSLDATYVTQDMRLSPLPLLMFDFAVRQRLLESLHASVRDLRGAEIQRLELLHRTSPKVHRHQAGPTKGRVAVE